MGKKPVLGLAAVTLVGLAVGCGPDNQLMCPNGKCSSNTMTQAPWASNAQAKRQAQQLAQQQQQAQQQMIQQQPPIQQVGFNEAQGVGRAPVAPPLTGVPQNNFKPLTTGSTMGGVPSNLPEPTHTGVPQAMRSHGQMPGDAAFAPLDGPPPVAPPPMTSAIPAAQGNWNSGMPLPPSPPPPAPFKTSVSISPPPPVPGMDRTTAAPRPVPTMDQE